MALCEETTFADVDALLAQIDERDLVGLVTTPPLPVVNELELWNDPAPTLSAAASAHIQPELALPLSCSSRFTAPKTDDDISAVQASAIPKNTVRNTTWAVNIWKEWTSHRRSICSPLDCPPHLLLCTVGQLDTWLSRFILEIRKNDGQPYPPQSLYSIVCGLMRYVRELHPEVNFFKDTAFTGFRRTMDGEMKRLRSLGLGTKKKRAEPITVDEEATLWNLQLLGSHTPKVLLDTMVFMCGMYFALRSGQEHRDLQLSQIELVQPSSGSPHLVYTENTSKNNKGGMAQRKLEAKQVIHHANLNNPSRCFVSLFQLYCQHCPPDRKNDAFYLTPLRNPKGPVWYSSVPVGHNTLGQTVKSLCKAAGIDGFKTNHSLRVTTATRLFECGADEQLIMARTGHRSIQGVRSYKRISDGQRHALSDMLNAATNGSQPPEKKAKLEVVIETNERPQKKPKLEVVTETNERTEKSHCLDTLPPQLNFSGCTSITINYHGPN